MKWVKKINVIRSKRTFTCSKSTIEPIQKGEIWLWICFTPFCSGSIVDFEQVSVSGVPHMKRNKYYKTPKFQMSTYPYLKALCSFLNNGTCWSTPIANMWYFFRPLKFTLKPFHPSVPFHIGTSHLFSSAKQMKRNTWWNGLILPFCRIEIWTKQSIFLQAKRYYINISADCVKNSDIF